MVIVTYQPGFQFCLPWMAPLYTRRAPSPRNFVHRSIVQLQRPSPQPAALLRKSKLAPSAPTRRFVTDRSRTPLVDQARSFD